MVAGIVAGEGMQTISSRHSRIFLLSHMRARTSLAGHVLGSHPAINGYYELHLDYTEPAALDRQLAAYLAHDTLKPGSRYLFDKLLHDDYALRPAALGAVEVKVLMTLLTPEHALKSIVTLFARKDAAHPYATPAGAADYYCRRLATLAAFARENPRRYHYYDAELFQHDPARLLARFAAWLELDSPLRERYRTFSQSGLARKGDTSPRLLSGRIERTPSDYAHVVLPQELLADARAAYRACREELAGHAAEALCLPASAP